MHLKFLRHGQGSGKKAVEYLLAEKDHQNKTRPNVHILEGDPLSLIAVIDSLKFKYRYTSGVISWSHEDKPTKEEIDIFLQDFKKLAFAGLRNDAFSWIAVLHGHPGENCHIHVIAARVELSTGKSFNIAPPGWEQPYDFLRDYHNLIHNWSDPKSPQNARIYQPFKTANHEINAISKYIVCSIANQNIQNRQALLAKLEEIGSISKVGVTYIDFKPDHSKKIIRLKEGVYHEKFFNRLRNLNLDEDAKRDRAETISNSQRIKDVRRYFEDAVSKRAQYNTTRYRPVPRRPQKSVGRTTTTNTEGDSKGAPSPPESLQDSSCDDSYCAHPLDLHDPAFDVHYQNLELEHSDSLTNRFSKKQKDKQNDRDRKLAHASYARLRVSIQQGHRFAEQSINCLHQQTRNLDGRHAHHRELVSKLHRAHRSAVITIEKCVGQLADQHSLHLRPR